MADVRLPALDPNSVAETRGSGYPEPFRSRMGDRAKRKLGDACGLTNGSRPQEWAVVLNAGRRPP